MEAAMPTRSQRHKFFIQGITSDGRVDITKAVIVTNPLIDQTSTNNVADTYQFAANTFTTPAGVQPLLYTATMPSGFSFNQGTRTFSWTKPTGVYNVTVYATNTANQQATDKFKITVT
jgi:hypothetical protein